MIAPALTVSAYVRAEYLLTHVLRKNSTYQLQRSVECFVRTLGHDPSIADLCDSFVNEWLVAAEKKYAPSTIRKMRGDVLAVWRDAVAAGYCDHEPKRVRRIKVPKPLPRAWTPDEVARLVAAAIELPGRLRNGNRRSDYFGGIASGAWSTGFRRSDLWIVQREHIHPDGTIAHSQHKTQDGHVACFDATALEYLVRLRGDCPFAWPYTSRMFYYWWNKLKAIAGVTSDGALQRIRKSATTDVVKNKLGSPTKFLGHTSPQADQYYIDWSLIPGTAVMPSPLPMQAARPPLAG